MDYKSVGSLLRQTFSTWNDHEAPRMGASIAFYTILSLAPLVILVLAILALVFDQTAAQYQLLGQVEYMIGKQGAEAIREMLEQAQKSTSGAVASIIGVITLLVGASGVFGEIQSALNKIWEVKSQSGGGLRALINSDSFPLAWSLRSDFSCWSPYF